MTTQQRIIIVIEDGQFKGASQQDGGQSPQPLDLAQLKTLLPEVELKAMDEIERLKSTHADELAEAQGQPRPSSPTAQVLADLSAAFDTTLPPDAQTSFAMPYAIVRVLVEAEKWRLAAAVIMGIEVPPELADAKQNLINIITAATK